MTTFNFYFNTRASIFPQNMVWNLWVQFILFLPTRCSWILGSLSGQWLRTMWKEKQAAGKASCWDICLTTLSLSISFLSLAQFPWYILPPPKTNLGMVSDPKTLPVSLPHCDNCHPDAQMTVDLPISPQSELLGSTRGPKATLPEPGWVLSRGSWKWLWISDLKAACAT